MFLALPNLVSTAVEPCVPWHFTFNPPEEIKNDKKARTKWITDSHTKHQVYTAFEGVIANQRVQNPKGADEGNPPLKLYAAVADIDTKVTEAELTEGIGRVQHVPNYMERTLSGNVRLVWIFEKPVQFPNRRFAIEYLQHLRERMGLEKIAPMFDKNAFDDPCRYYTNSGDWRVIDANARVPAALTGGWIVEVAEKHVWKKDKGAVDIPLPIVAAELAKKYPRFSDWPGDFVEQAQGPSFWLPESVSPKSAIVKPTGMFTFASHAIKPFYSWHDLLGKDFVDKYRAEQMGKAVEGIYHDGKSYFRQDGYGAWKAFSKEDIAMHLATARGLSSVKDNGMPSEVNRALEHIQHWHGVDGAAPFVFQPSGALKRNGNSFLNTSTRRPMTPAIGTAVWGPMGQFPFISALIDGLFHPDSKPANPKDFFLSWLSRAYRGAYENNMESGQIGMLLGIAGIGKTFLSQGLLSALMGGHAEAQDYMLGLTQFNSQLFEVGWWTIDDNSIALDGGSHRKWSAMGKKMAANTIFEYHAKFRIPSQIDWRGRLFVTANDDEESSRIVPDLSMSLLDKLMLWRTAKVCPVVFPDRRGCDKIIREEGPWFARFLLDYVIPEHCRGTSRFGVKSYQEASLVQVAEQSSSTASFAEVLEDWRSTYFGENPNVREWKGTAHQLLVEFKRNEARASALHNLTGQQVGRNLSAILSKGGELHGVSCQSSALGRLWTVVRPPATAPSPIELPLTSKFAKA